jgi:hypothetical protein
MNERDRGIDPTIRVLRDARSSPIRSATLNAVYRVRLLRNSIPRRRTDPFPFGERKSHERTGPKGRSDDSPAAPRTFITNSFPHREPPVRQAPPRRSAATTSPLARDSDRRNAQRASGAERNRAGRERRAGRDDVVDQHDPATLQQPAVAASAEAEGTRDVAGSFGSVEIELRRRGTRSLKDRRDGESQLAAGDDGDELRLVVAAAPQSIGVDRDGNQSVAAGAGKTPAAGDGTTQRLRQALLAGVLQLVQRRTDDADEGRTPLELEQVRRHLRREPDRNAGRQLESGVEGREARRAQRGAFAATPGAARREGEIEDAAEQRGHGGIVAADAYPSLTPAVGDTSFQRRPPWRGRQSRGCCRRIAATHASTDS